MMDAFLQDLRVAARGLLRRPVFTAVAAGTLALGLGSTTAMFSVVRGVLLRPLPLHDPATLVTLQGSAPTGGAPASEVSWADFRDWRSASSFSSMAAWRRGTATLTGLGDPEVLPAAAVTSDFFRVFAAPPVMGREFAPDETVEGGPAVVVVAHTFWQGRLASDPDVLSRRLELDGVPHQVVGVAPPDFGFPGAARIWRPVQNRAGCLEDCRYLNVIARLADGTSLERARQEMSGMAARLAGRRRGGEGGGGVMVVPLHDVVVGDVRPGLLMVLGAVVLVLLIACANVANLLLVRGAGRTGEVVVRAALGADRRRIVRQLLVESLALAVVAGALGLILAVWGVDLVRAVAPSDLPRMAEVGVDASVVAFTTGLVLATSLLFGVGPALRLSRRGRAARLDGGRGGGGGSPRRGWWRTALLVTEVALSLVLLTGAGVLLRSSREVHRLDPGFDPEGVLTFGVSLPEARYPGYLERARFFGALEERLALHPRVEAVGSAAGSPLGGRVTRSPFRRADRPVPRPELEPSAVVHVATDGYFRTLRIPLLEGRPFDRRDGVGDPRVALVSRTAAERLWPGEDPVGSEIVLDPVFGGTDSVATVVGVVGDTRTLALTDPPSAEVYLSYRQIADPEMTVHVRALPGTGGTPGLGPVARAQVRALDPDLPLLRVETLEERVRAATARSRFYLTMLTLFAVVAVALAAVGLYGVVAFLVTRRTREIGIRMALGAEEGHVVRLVLREGFVPALSGIVLGLAGALATTRLLGSLLFRVAPSDPTTVVTVASLLLAVVLAASLAPARRAARIPPAEALRRE